MGRGSLLLQGLGPARGSHREGPGALQTQPPVSSGHPQFTCQPKARGPGGPVEQVTICLSPHSPLQGPHTHTHTYTHTHPNIYQKNSSHPLQTLLMDPVGKQDCLKSAPHLSLPAKSLSSGKRGQCWCLSHRLGLRRKKGFPLPLHILYTSEQHTFGLRNVCLLTGIFSYFNYSLSKHFYFVLAIYFTCSTFLFIIFPFG